MTLCSGGERRRLAIGLELVTNPNLLFLDEPTSAVDSSNARSIVLLLRRLADGGRTVICSVHQYPAPLFCCFDRVLVLTRTGDTLFFGAPSEVASYVSQCVCFPCWFHTSSRIGRPIAEHVSPPEYLMELAIGSKAVTVKRRPLCLS